MAKPTTKAAVKPATKKRFVDAMGLLASMESVAIAEDKKVSVDAPVQKDNKDDVCAPNPNEEVDASAQNTPTKELKDTTQDGTAHTQDVGKVKVTETTDAGNAEEVDSVSNKTPDAVKAGEKDLTTGVVSQEDSIEANEAEHIAPKEADDAVMNIEQAVEDLEATGITVGSDTALQKAEAVGNDLENINKVEAALEQFQTMLVGMRKRGKKPTHEVAQAIKIALESHDRVFFRPIVSSLEDFARPDTQLVASKGLEAAITDKLKDLGKAAGNAVVKLVHMLIDAWNHFTRDTPKLIEELTKITKELQTAKLEGGASHDIKGAGRLMINGNFIGDSVEVARNVEKTSRELLVEWPQALIKLATTVEGKGKEVVATEDANNTDAIEEAAQTALEATFGQFKQVDSGEAPSSLSNFPIVTRSPILPGNKAMFIGVQDGTNASVNIASSTFMKFDFASTGDVDQATESVQVPSAERAIATINAVKEIVGNLIGKDTSMAALKSLGKTLTSDAGTKQGDVVRGAIQAALMQHRMYMGYLTSLVKAYIGFYRQLLDKVSTGTEVATKTDGKVGATDGKSKDHEEESVVSTQ
ncbi:internal head protein [Pseudomonas phage Psa21]|uniref:Virion structural protein n=1 Tax=Pseudomonas phage Psa21 TaxID=2530023 RepID=A0A481W4N4_9CAUD|nr:internal head protein [Pseudomonas phage Psa21]QBJ02746.1 virion structural protein [Pseudomonas phage Psa21]